MKNINHRHTGFTLLELMIVVTIIGILASIAYPAYQDSVRKARRAEAKSALVEAANSMERYYTQNGSYTGAVAGTTFSSTVPTNGQGTIFYNLTLASTTTTFTITATPTAAQSDPQCANLSLTQTNAKGETGTGTVADCWN